MSALSILKNKALLSEIAEEVFNSSQNQDGSLNWEEITLKLAEKAEQHGIEVTQQEEIDLVLQEEQLNKGEQISLEKFLQFYKKLLIKQAPEYQDDEEKEGEQEQGKGLTKKQKNEEKLKLLEKEKLKKIEEAKKKKEEEAKQKNTENKNSKSQSTLAVLKKELKDLKDARKNATQGNAPKVVYTWLNSDSKDQEVQEIQKKLIQSAINLNQSQINPSPSKSKPKLNPIIQKQQIKQNNFKSLDEFESAQASWKTPLLGIALKKVKAKDEKYQMLFDKISKLTDKEFDSSYSILNFDKIEQKLKSSANSLIVLHIESIKYTKHEDLKVKSKLELKRLDLPALFKWEVKHNQSTLFLNNYKEFDNQQNECLDFIFTNNYINPIEVIFWKKERNEQDYIGQFNIYPSEFESFDPLYDRISRRLLSAKLKQSKKLEKLQPLPTSRSSRSLKGFDAFLGEVTINYKIIRYCQRIRPENSLSNRVGSPRTLEERRRRQLVDFSKDGPYQWPDDPRNKEIVKDINEAMSEIEITLNMEDIKNAIENNQGFMTVLIETKYEIAPGVRRTKYERRRVQTEQMVVLIKSLEEDPNKTIYQTLKKTIIKGRVPKKLLEDSLQSMGCTAQDLFFKCTDDMGACEFDILLETDCYGAVIDILPDMKLDDQQNGEILDEMGEKMMHNIKKQLKSGKSLEALAAMLRAGQQLPDFGLVIAQMAVQYQNSPANPDSPSLLQYFDVISTNPDKMANYEHIIVMGKLLKLAKQYIPEAVQGTTNMIQDLESKYKEAKTGIYFSVPTLPKKLDLERKKDMLILGQNFGKEKERNRFRRKAFWKQKENVEGAPARCFWNIFHEGVRRRRWNLLHKGFENGPDMFYQPDQIEMTPLMYLLEEAPYEVILAMLADYSPNRDDNQSQKQSSQQNGESRQNGDGPSNRKGQNAGNDDDNENNQDPDDDGDQPGIRVAQDGDNEPGYAQAPNNEQAQGGEQKEQPMESKPIPKLDVQQLLMMKTSQNKNLIHCLVLNFNPQPEGQVKTFELLKSFLPENEFNQMITTPLEGLQMTPFLLFVNRLARIENQVIKSDLEINKTLLKALSQPLQLIKPDISIRTQIFMLGLVGEDEFDEDSKKACQDHMINHTQLARAMAQHQQNVFELVQSEFETYLNWFDLNLSNITKEQDQFAIFNLARQAKFSFIDQQLKKFMAEYPNLQFKPFSEDQNDLPTKFTFENGQIKVEFAEEQGYEVAPKVFDQAEFKQRINSFYKKYPLEVLVGLLDIFKDFGYKPASTISLIQQLITQIVKAEPAVLNNQLYIRAHRGASIVKDLVRLGFSQLLDSLDQSIKTVYCNDVEENKFLAAAQQGKDYPIESFDSKIISELKSAVRQLFATNNGNLLLDFIPKLITQQKKEVTQQLQKHLISRVFEELLKSPSGFKTGKFMQMLRQNPALVPKSIFRYYNAAVTQKNAQLSNQLLALCQSVKLNNYSYKDSIKFKRKEKTHDRQIKLKSFSQSIYSKAALNFYPLVLNKGQLKQLLEECKDFLTQDDYSIMTYALARNGQAEKLELVVNKLKTPEGLLVSLRETLLRLGMDYNISFKTNYKDPKAKRNRYGPAHFSATLFNSLIDDRTPVLPNKNQLILSQKRNLDLPKKQEIIPCFWFTSQGGGTQAQNKKLEEQYHQDQWKQQQRKTFLTQTPALIFNSVPAEQKNMNKTVELLQQALMQQQLDEYLTKKPEMLKCLKKLYLLPLASDQYDLLNKSPKPNLTILKAIDQIIQFQLQLNPTPFQFTQIKALQYKNIQFIKQFWKKNLVETMKQEVGKTRRIIRSLDYTLKRGRTQIQKSFAVEVCLTLVKTFESKDFEGIVTNHNQVFNAIAVALVRAKTDNQEALTWIGTVLKTQKFFEFVHSVPMDDDLKNKKASYQVKAEKRRLAQITLIPENIEILEAERVLVPSVLNQDYALKLLKAKARPFFKTYTLQKPMDGTLFKIANDKLEQVTLLEYLCLMNNEKILKNYQLKASASEYQQLDQPSQRKWCFIACSCGNVNIFDMILSEILKMNYQQFVSEFSDAPLLHQIFLRFNEAGAQQLFARLVEPLQLPYKELSQTDPNFEKLDKLLTISSSDQARVFEVIINKQYSHLYWQILGYLRRQNPNLYASGMLSTLLESKKETNLEEPKMTLLQKSIANGFPDLAMSIEPGVIVSEEISEDLEDILGNGILLCGKELAFLNNELQSKNKLPGRVGYYELWQLLRQGDFAEDFTSKNIQKQYQAQFMLFKLLSRTNAYLKFFDRKIIQFCNINKEGWSANPFLINMEAANLRQVENQFKLVFNLHISGFDEILGFKLKLSQFLQQYYKNTKIFWLQKPIQEAFLKHFNIDLMKPKKVFQENAEDPEEQSNPSLLEFDSSPEILKYYRILNEISTFFYEVEASEDQKVLSYQFFCDVTYLPIFARIACLDEHSYKIKQYIEEAQKLELSDLYYLLLFVGRIMIYLGIDRKQYEIQNGEPMTRIGRLVKDLLSNGNTSLQVLNSQLANILNKFKQNQFYLKLIQNQKVPPDSNLAQRIMQDKVFVGDLLEFLKNQIDLENLKCKLDQKMVVYFYEQEFPKEDPYQNCKLYRGIQLVKLTLDLILEVGSLQELIKPQQKLNIEFIKISAKESNTKQTVLLKHSVKKDEYNELEFIEYFLSVPLTFSERNGYATATVNLNHRKQLAHLVSTNFFEIADLKILQNSVSQTTMDLQSTIFKQELSLVGLSYESYDAIAQAYEQMFGLKPKEGKSELSKIYDERLSLFVSEDDMLEGTSDYQSRETGNTIEDEMKLEKYFECEMEITLKLQLSTQEQLIKKCKFSSQIKLMLDDFKLTMKTLKAQKEAKTISRNVDWPFSITPDKQVKADLYNYPPYLLYSIGSLLIPVFQQINLISFIDSYIEPFISRMEMLNQKSKISLSELVNQALAWPLLNYLIQTITKKVQDSKTSNMIFEMIQIPKSRMVCPTTTFEGFDSLIRFGQTRYFNHKGFVIIRLGIIFMKSQIQANDLNHLKMIKNLGDVGEYTDKILNFEKLESLKFEL